MVTHRPLSEKDPTPSYGIPSSGTPSYIPAPSPPPPTGPRPFHLHTISESPNQYPCLDNTPCPCTSLLPPHSSLCRFSLFWLTSPLHILCFPTPLFLRWATLKDRDFPLPWFQDNNLGMEKSELDRRAILQSRSWRGIALGWINIDLETFLYWKFTHFI